jgi:hypothetical protein
MLDFSDKAPTQYTLYQNELNGKYYLMGVYMDDYKKAKYSGVFCTEVPEKKIPKMKMELKEFDNELLSLLDKDGYANDEGRKKGLDYPFGIKNVFTRDDVSMDLVLEYNHEERNINTTSRGQIINTVSLLSGPIVDIHFVNGSIKFTRIPKSQKHAITNAYNSCYSFKVGNKLVFLYNDTKRNTDDPIERSPSTMVNPKSAVLVAAIIDENDKIERKEIWDNGDGNYACEPISFIKLQRNSILLIQSKIGFANFKYRMAILKAE